MRSVILSLLLIATLCYADEPKKKKTAVSLADAASRAFAKARKFDSRLVRVSMAADTGDDDEKAVLFAEFSNGCFGVFAGFADEEQDQWIVLEPKNIELLQECASRSRERASKVK